MDHAIDTGERRAATLVAVRVELLLGEDITAVLVVFCQSPFRRLPHAIEIRKETNNSPRTRRTPSCQICSAPVRSRAQSNPGRSGDHCKTWYTEQRLKRNRVGGFGDARQREIGRFDELECGEEEETGRRKLSLADEVPSIRASRMHEMRRVSAERDTRKIGISLRFSFFSLVFCASKIERKGKGAWIRASPIREYARLNQEFLFFSPRISGVDDRSIRVMYRKHERRTIDSNRD